MNAMQERALHQLTALFQEHVDRHNELASEKTKQALVVQRATTEPGAEWVTVTIEYPNAKGTMLSALGGEWWHINIGPRGRLVAWSYPKSVEQFAGRRKGWCGIRIRRPS